jgi:hypothetical protein
MLWNGGAVAKGRQGADGLMADIHGRDSVNRRSTWGMADEVLLLLLLLLLLPLLLPCRSCSSAYSAAALLLLCLRRGRKEGAQCSK